MAALAEGIRSVAARHQGAVANASGVLLSIREVVQTTSRQVAELIRQVLDEQRAAGRQVLPYCPFVKAYISSHPDYLDLVPASQRAKFGLEADA